VRPGIRGQGRREIGASRQPGLRIREAGDQPRRRKWITGRDRSPGQPPNRSRRPA